MTEEREKVIKESEEAIDILAKAEEPTFWMDFVRCAFENTLSLLKEQPEIVRCKDCKFFIGEGHYCKIRGMGRALKLDDFCSDGRAVK